MSVLVPMAFGVAAAALLYGQFAPEGVAFPTFALFMAPAMSITAFPIMARILKERGMTHSLIGRRSLTAAALADVLAWIMLALAAAVAGKVLGGAAGARIAGFIGRDLFTMLMVMAILTTFMTGPLLTLFAGKGDAQVAEARETVARP
jgi:Kef-type K+ transport system membrane component KefB